MSRLTDAKLINQVSLSTLSTLHYFNKMDASRTAPLCAEANNVIASIIMKAETKGGLAVTVREEVPEAIRNVPITFVEGYVCTFDIIDSWFLTAQLVGPGQIHKILDAYGMQDHSMFTAIECLFGLRKFLHQFINDNLIDTIPTTHYSWLHWWFELSQLLVGQFSPIIPWETEIA
jgi:hypothetical protein